MREVSNHSQDEVIIIDDSWAEFGSALPEWSLNLKSIIGPAIARVLAWNQSDWLDECREQYRKYVAQGVNEYELQLIRNALHRNQLTGRSYLRLKYKKESEDEYHCAQEVDQSRNHSDGSVAEK